MILLKFGSLNTCKFDDYINQHAIFINTCFIQINTPHTINLKERVSNAAKIGFETPKVLVVTQILSRTPF